VSERRTALVLGLAASALGTAGCGGLFDVVYLIGNKRTSTTVDERSPTGQVHQRIEYEGRAGSAGVVEVTCEERERRIERASSVEKTYRYRGGYTSAPYIGSAALSAVTTGAVAGVIALVCMNEKDSTQAQKESCLQNMLFATPFAVDTVYSSIRAATAKTPKLIEKRRSNPRLVFSETPSRTAPASCVSARLVLRPMAGPSEQSADDLLSGAPPPPAPLFMDGATAVALPPDGKVDLRSQPEVVSKWADDPGLALWLVGADGRPRRLEVNRCDALKPLLDMLPPPAQTKLLTSCAPKPAQPAAR
jgi:hypothetical protein